MMPQVSLENSSPRPYLVPPPSPSVTDSRKRRFFSPLCLPAEGSAGSALVALLVEQAALKQAELDAHPVRSSMKQLLRSLDQLCPFEPDGDPARPDYVRSFLDYVNTLASVLVRSLGSEGKGAVCGGVRKKAPGLRVKGGLVISFPPQTRAVR